MDRQPQAVHIGRVLADRIEVDGTRPVVVPPGKGKLEFRFAALNVAAPGRYTFRVTAANADGIWNETGAALALTLQAHFCQTRWFFGLCAGALLGSGALAAKELGGSLHGESTGPVSARASPSSFRSNS